MTSEGGRRTLLTLVLAQLAGTSPWFAVNAVMGDLQREFGWAASEVGTLTSAVQFGFIAGTLVFALGGVADRFDARRVFAWSALASAGCALASMATMSTAGADGFATLWLWRAAGGFCLAGIYPVGMKLAAQHFPQGLGVALGWLVGALVLGSASPHALRALVELGAGWPWRGVFLGVAVATLAAGAAVRWGLAPVGVVPGSGAAPPRFSVSSLVALWADRRLRASAFGYFGHMVELYTMWVLVPLILATRLQGAALSWAAFAVLAAGFIGCAGGGWWAARWGRADGIAGRAGSVGSARVAGVQLAASGTCCLLAPWALGAPDGLFALWLLLWGITVAGDSPQFSALTAKNSPPHAVGSTLTLVNCIGFAVSIVSILVFTSLAERVSLAMLLPWLAIGPALGLWALAPLWRSSAAR